MSISDRHYGSLREPQVTEISEGIFAYVQHDGGWWINNTGFLVGRRGVTSVDTCSTERRTRAYLAAIGSVTGRPVRTLVNTHHHGDHTHGNYLFADATIVGHELCRDSILAAGFPPPGRHWADVEWGHVELEPPFVTYREGLTLYVDDLRCEVRHVGTPAHTNNDSIVWVPERRLLFAGDLLSGGGTAFFLQGSIAGAIEVLTDQLKPFGAQIIVPGHGRVSGPEIIDDTLDYLHFVQDTARQGIAAGVSPLEAARQSRMEPYAKLVNAERIAGNLHRAYAEESGAARGAPIDAAAAFDDMVAYNGGRPLTCLA